MERLRQAAARPSRDARASLSRHPPDGPKAVPELFWVCIFLMRQSAAKAERNRTRKTGKKRKQDLSGQFPREGFCRSVRIQKIRNVSGPQSWRLAMSIYPAVNSIAPDGTSVGSVWARAIVAFE